MKLAGKTTKEIMRELQIRNKTQVETWMRWYKNEELHRLEQPVGKQYTYGKGPEFTSDVQRLEMENQFLKQQIEVLKKYKVLERKWFGKLS